MKLKSVNHMYNVLINCLDMKIINITVCDQESSLPIEFNDKRLKINNDGHTLVHRGEMEFKPLLNFKQAHQLFSIALQHAAEDDGLYVQIFYDRKCEDNLHSFVEMKTNTGLIKSRSFYNVNLCYIDLIFTLSGMLIDNLDQFDTEPLPEGEEPKKKRVPRFPLKDLL